MNTEQLKTKKTVEEFMTEAGAKAVSEVAKTLLDFHSKHPVKELSDFAQQEIQRDRESRWISVNDKRPERYQRVLVFTSYAGNECQHIVTYNRGIWSGDESDVFNVTHWQPLPEAPKQLTP